VSLKNGSIAERISGRFDSCINAMAFLKNSLLAERGTMGSDKGKVQAKLALVLFYECAAVSYRWCH
jgi:hypothetical protein